MIIFRDGEIKLIKIGYTLSSKTGVRLQEENKVGIVAKNADMALKYLRKIINQDVEIGITEISDGGPVHIIVDEVTNVIKNKKEVTTNDTEKRSAGRPPGAKNKPKE